MDIALDNWTALNEHASKDGYELTKQLTEFDTCTNQPEKYEVYGKDVLEVSPEKNRLCPEMKAVTKMADLTKFYQST